MSKQEKIEKIKRQLDEMERVRANALEQIERMRKKIVEARDRLVRKRDVSVQVIHKNVDQNIISKRNEKYKEIQRNLNATAKLIQTKHELIRQQINPQSLQRSATLRVDRGMEVLERVIQGLRQSTMGETFLDKVSLDDFISDAIKAEAEKITETNFFKSIQKQLEEHGGN